MWVLGIDSGSLQEHPAVSTTGPSLQPSDPIFFFFCGRNFFYLGSTDLARLVGHELQGSVCLCSPGVGVPGKFFQVFNVGTGDANSGPVACAADISLTESSSRSYFQDLKRCSHVGYLVLSMASK